MGRAATERQALVLAKDKGYSPKRRQTIGPRFADVGHGPEWTIEVSA